MLPRVTVLLALACAWAVTAAQPASAQDGGRQGISWAVAPEFGDDSDGDGVIDAGPAVPAEPTDSELESLRSAVNPSDGFLVNLDACRVPVGGSDPSYAWIIDRAETLTGGCEIEIPLGVGEHEVTVTVQTDSDSTTQRTEVAVDPLVVASVGDGWGAGAGAPIELVPPSTSQLFRTGVVGLGSAAARAVSTAQQAEQAAAALTDAVNLLDETTIAVAEARSACFAEPFGIVVPTPTPTCFARLADAGLGAIDDLTNLDSRLAAATDQAAEVLEQARETLGSAQETASEASRAFQDLATGVRTFFVEEPTEWSYDDDQCRRSTLASPSLVAAELSRNNPQPVVFLHLACEGTGISTVGEQLDVLATITDGVELDLLIMSLSGYSGDAARVLRACTRRADCTSTGSDDVLADALCLPLSADLDTESECREAVATSSPPPGDIATTTGADITTINDVGMDELVERVAALGGEPAEVQVIGPPSPVRSAGGLCATSGFDLDELGQPDPPPGFTGAEAALVDRLFLDLDRALADATEDAGWRYSSTIGALAGHAYCDSRSWVVTGDDAWFEQAEPTAFGRPNEEGYAAIAGPIASDLQSRLLESDDGAETIGLILLAAGLLALLAAIAFVVARRNEAEAPEG